MASLLRRFRWWLIFACLAAGVGVIGWWQLSVPPERFTRAKYDRIRIGMTPAEVASAMADPHFLPPGFDPDSGHVWYDPDSGHECYDEPIRFGFLYNPPSGTNWDRLAEGLPLTKGDWGHVWRNESVLIWVFYRDGKIIRKQMEIRMPPWKVKVREWLDWLRGLVGW